jgi:hypothetical protein
MLAVPILLLLVARAPSSAADPPAQTARPAPQKNLSLRELAARPIDVRPGRTFIGADSASHTVFFYENRRATVFRVNADSGDTLELTLEDAPGFSSNSVSPARGALLDGHGETLIPARWRGHAGIFVFSNSGRYLNTILLNPPVEIENMARGSDGSLYILGVDPSSRLLVHKYAGDGRRTTAFSSGGPAEAQQGLLWTDGGLIYQISPASRRLRVFDASGKTLRDVAIECPPDAPASIQTAVPAAGGRFVVEWAAAGTSVAQRYLSLHEESGRAISAATPESGRSAVIFSDSAGILYSLRYTPAGRQEIVRTRFTQTAPGR